MPSRSNEKERSELKGGFRGNVNTDSRKKESCLTLLFSVNPPGLEAQSIAPASGVPLSADRRSSNKSHSNPATRIK